MDAQAPDKSHGRFLTVTLTGIIGVALVGFAVGTRPAPEPSRVFSPIPTAEGAIPGQSYAELRDRRYGPNQAVTSNVDQFAKDLVPVDGKLATPEERRAAVALRQRRRAYEGAPPVIPHVIDEQSSGACLSCHENGVKIAGRIASPLSHPLYQSCTQCHVPAVDTKMRPMPRFLADDAPALPAAENAFAGMRSPGSGTRAWKGSPPMVPHRVFMRERCESCHGPAGQDGLRTPHPRNTSCTQCHVSAARSEISGAPPFQSVPGARTFGQGLRDRSGPLQ